MLSELNITFLVQTLHIPTKSTAQFFSNSCLKNGTQKEKFPMWKSREQFVRNTISYILCSKWSPFAQTLACLLCRPYVVCCCQTSCLQTLAIYSQTVVRLFSYVRRSHDIETTSVHRLLFTKHGACTTGVNMSVNLQHTCLCRTTVIAGFL